MIDSFLDRLQMRLAERGDNKITSSNEAIEQIKPGSTLHIAVTHSVPFALAFEITRTFWGTMPRFELVTLGASVNVQVMIRNSGFLRRLITSYAGNVYPSPAPALVFQENYRTGEVPIENWSLMTLVQRLMAGALNLPFVPTNSLAKSGMEEENTGSTLARIPDPFGNGEQMVVQSLVPDYTIVHGWAADPSGNILARAPWTERNFGALAARKGVIASVDKIVDHDYVLEHHEDLLVPASRTIAIVNMPYGAHPSPCRGYQPDWGYAEDEQFLLEFRKASKELTSLDEWAKKWVLDVGHEKYLHILGGSRLDSLCRRASPDAWKKDTENQLLHIDFSAPPLPTEQMIIAMAKICIDRVLENHYRTILAGQGTSNLAAWLAYYQLADKGVDVDLMAEIGFYGYAPLPPQPLIFNFANIATCKGVESALDILGIHVSGARHKECIGMLGAAIIDRYGNVNSTCVPEMKLWLLGSGGANDVLSGAEEVIVCCPQESHRLWPKVPYVTGPGTNVSTLVTTQGIFRKPSADSPFRLMSVFTPSENPEKSTDSIVEHIVENTGWEVEASNEVERLPLPESDILRLLRIFDPSCYYLR
ncbi:MAG: CoA-transferase [Candidatus Thorarchaeota archaeon]